MISVHLIELSYMMNVGWWVWRIGQNKKKTTIKKKHSSALLQTNETYRHGNLLTAFIGIQIHLHFRLRKYTGICKFSNGLPRCLGCPCFIHFNFRSIELFWNCGRKRRRNISMTDIKWNDSVFRRILFYFIFILLFLKCQMISDYGYRRNHFKMPVGIKFCDNQTNILTGTNWHN